ncbi:MAG: tRNA lysidine(34) synthetase TilS [Desulfovermiculus sp.]|nr:tRNA lysidine(34) synthetase TilS [Desulfovermiculus sp.]
MSKLTLQNLPPKWAHFCLDICSFVHGELGLDLQSRTLLLAASRGVDSTALILWAHLTRPRLGTSLIAAHLDHGLRSQAQAEAASLQELTQDLHIPFHLGQSKVFTYAQRRNVGLEEAGRILRYRFLSGTARKRGADYLLTAHHLNDLAEDVLMRQIRGTGWPALAGMPAWNFGNQVLRPFLLTPKQDLLDFVRACGQTWMEDSSNQDLSFTRNRIRHQILPLLLKENPGFLSQTADLWRQAQVDGEYWNMDLQAHISSELVLPQGILLPAERLDDLHPAQRLRWYRHVLEQQGPGQALANTLFILDRAWQQRAWHKRFQFPGNKEIRITPQGLVCSKVI